MPTVLRVGPYRFFFYSGDGSEPPHIHVEASGKTAKYWLSPIAPARIGGFSAREARDVERIITTHHTMLLEAWRDYFGQP